MSDYVVCGAKITSPYLSEHMLSLGLRPNMPCGCKLPVIHEAEAMSFSCPRGHRFYASSADIVRETAHTTAHTEPPEPA